MALERIAAVCLLKSATNLALIDFAAAPETCCPIIPLARALKGFISSASPVGEKSGHGYFSTRGRSRASVLRRWATASSRTLPVVVVGRGSRPVFDGEESPAL